MKKSDASQGQPASELISKRIAELGDWRGETLGRIRKLIKQGRVSEGSSPSLQLEPRRKRAPRDQHPRRRIG